MFINVELFSVQGHFTLSLQGTLNSVWRQFRWLQLGGWRGETVLGACNVWSPGMLLTSSIQRTASPSNRVLLGLESLQCWGWPILTESHGYTCVIRAVGYGRLLIEEETLEPDYEGFSKIFCFFSLCVCVCVFIIIALLHSAFRINFFVTSWSCINFIS